MTKCNWGVGGSGRTPGLGAGTLISAPPSSAAASLAARVGPALQTLPEDSPARPLPWELLDPRRPF